MLTVQPIKDFPLVNHGDILSQVLIQSLQKNSIKLDNGDILVIAQKIVSKAEGRFVNLNEVNPSTHAIEIAGKTDKDARFVELVLRESKEVLRASPGILVVEHKKGFICANAGIDHSNVSGPWGNSEDWVLLLPEDADHSAQRIRREIIASTGVNIGVLIIDSHGRAWRNGTVGITIGISGMPAIVDLRGKPDIFGYRLKITQVAVADELAAAASLMMGQANEMTPVVHVRGFPYPLSESCLSDLLRTKERDLFR